MATIATELPRISNWLKWELAPEVGYCRKTVTLVVAAAGVLPTGTVLGKITASGKYVVALETAADGSKVPDAILIEELSLAAGEYPVAVLLKGPAIVGKNGLGLDASYDTPAKLEVAYAALEAKNINVVEQI